MYECTEKKELDDEMAKLVTKAATESTYEETEVLIEGKRKRKVNTRYLVDEIPAGTCCVCDIHELYHITSSVMPVIGQKVLVT